MYVYRWSQKSALFMIYSHFSSSSDPFILMLVTIKWHFVNTNAAVAEMLKSFPQNNLIINQAAEWHLPYLSILLQDVIRANTKIQYNEDTSIDTAAKSRSQLFVILFPWTIMWVCSSVASMLVTYFMDMGQRVVVVLTQQRCMPTSW